MKYIVYKHENIVNNKKYFGITSRKAEKRWRNGNGYSGQPYFYNAIKKYGWNNFEHIIIAENLTEEDAKKLEKELIAKFNSFDPKFGYNLTHGGEGNRPNKATLEKLSGANNYHAKAVINLNTGELFVTVKEAALAYGVTPSVLYELLAGKQKSVANCFWCTLEDYKRLSSEQIKEIRNNKIKAFKRVVINLTTGKIFSSIKEGARAYNISHSAIFRHITGKSKSAAKCQWDYLDRYEDRTPREIEEIINRNFGHPKGSDNAKARAVMNLTTGETFLTITEAAKAYNIKQSTLSTHLAGRSKTAANCHWKYVDNFKS